MLLRNRFLVAAAAGLALAVGGGITTAQAVVITYQTSGTGNDGPLAASAIFTTGAGVIDLTLSNNLATDVIRSAGQALSDITFTLSNAPGTVGTLSASGQLGDVADGGLVTYTSGSPVRFVGQGPPPPNGTGSFTITGNTITMEALGGGQPSQMIVPSIANGGTFTNTNNGFDNFDPYTIGPATFSLNLSGVTANTTVTAATFSFGTGPDTFLPGTPGTPGQQCANPPCTTQVPEPQSLAMLGGGLIGMAGVLWWRRRRYDSNDNWNAVA